MAGRCRLVTQWALFHEVLDRQACCVERSSDRRRLASQKLTRPSMRRVMHKATTEFRRPVERRRSTFWDWSWPLAFRRSRGLKFGVALRRDCGCRSGNRCRVLVKLGRVVRAARASDLCGIAAPAITCGLCIQPRPVPLRVDGPGAREACKARVVTRRRSPLPAAWRRWRA
jgi:hypothetical protein